MAARGGGSVVEIGGVCGADNNSTSAGCVGASGCSGGAAGVYWRRKRVLIRNRVNSCTFSLIYLYILYYNLFPKSQNKIKKPICEQSTQTHTCHYIYISFLLRKTKKTWNWHQIVLFFKLIENNPSKYLSYVYL